MSYAAAVAATWSGPAPDSITAWLLVQTGHVVGRRFRQALADCGVSPTQFGVLLELDLHPGLANAEIARVVMVTPQSMSELLTSLLELGLIDRTPSAGRGHRLPAQLTADGRRVLAHCQTAVATVQDSLALDQADTQQLNVLLHRILGTS